jgi:hypothetical protein
MSHSGQTGAEAETGGKEKGITPLPFNRGSTRKRRAATGLIGDGFMTI